jgi:hypothetical protein
MNALFGSKKATIQACYHSTLLACAVSGSFLRYMLLQEPIKDIYTVADTEN